jgi:hypothetical protein
VVASAKLHGAAAVNQALGTAALVHGCEGSGCGSFRSPWWNFRAAVGIR